MLSGRSPALVMSQLMSPPADDQELSSAPARTCFTSGGRRSVALVMSLLPETLDADQLGAAAHYRLPPLNGARRRASTVAFTSAALSTG
jgi:hypothetical protein